MNEINHQQFLSVAQAAKLLGLTRQAVAWRCKNGLTRALRVGKAYVIPRATLFMERA